jgi:hypothetical protein
MKISSAFFKLLHVDRLADGQGEANRCIFATFNCECM